MVVCRSGPLGRESRILVEPVSAKKNDHPENCCTLWCGSPAPQISMLSDVEAERPCKNDRFFRSPIPLGNKVAPTLSWGARGCVLTCRSSGDDRFFRRHRNRCLCFLYPDVAKIDVGPRASAIIGLWCASHTWARDCSCILHLLRGSQHTVSAMAPHLSAHSCVGCLGKRCPL